MIVYRVELWCDGCFKPLPLSSGTACVEIPQNCERLLEMGRVYGWVTDGVYQFCPKCQIQRHGVAQQADAEKTLQALKSKIIQ